MRVERHAAWPASCAIALETPRLYEKNDLVGHVRAVFRTFVAEFEACSTHSLIITAAEIREMFAHVRAGLHLAAGRIARDAAA